MLHFGYDLVRGGNNPGAVGISEATPTSGLLTVRGGSSASFTPAVVGQQQVWSVAHSAVLSIKEHVCPSL